MPAEMSVYICDAADQVATARQFMRSRGYSESGITDEQASVFIYDAKTYDGGKSDDLAGKFVVIGRK